MALVDICSCRFCGKSFTKRHKYQVFCQKLCRMAYSGYSKVPTKNLICDKCGKEFQSQYPRSRFCSKKCRQGCLSYVRVTRGCDVTCEECGVISYSPSGARRFCNNICRLKNVKKRQVQIKNELHYGDPIKKDREDREEPVGYYVYLWIDSDVVFYVGRGCNKNRAYTKHMLLKTEAMCETHRNKIGDRFKVIILEDRLTEVAAKFLEAALIKLLKPFTNQKEGDKTFRSDVDSEDKIHLPKP